MSSILKINLLWTIGVLVAVIISLLSVKWSGVQDLAGILNFALGLTSFVLAIVAIVYGFISNNALSGVVSEIKTAATGINDIAKGFPDKLITIEKTTTDMHRILAGSQAQSPSPPQTQPTIHSFTPAGPQQESSGEILKFVNNVIEDFLRVSSWNGLKLFHACQICLHKKVPFDLKLLCSVDNSMSYDYAIGYLVASASAQFVVYTSPDNVKISVTSMPPPVLEKLSHFINGRLDFVGADNAKEFWSQLRRIEDHLARVGLKQQIANAFKQGAGIPEDPPA